MSGKQHSFIGVSISIALFIFLFLKYSTNIGLYYIIPLTFGSLVGSLIPDIDSKKSKASQIVNKIIIVISLVVVILSFIQYSYYQIPHTVLPGTPLDLKSRILGQIVTISNKFIHNDTSTVLFFVLVILGKLSPHRQFTHKWFGATLFCVCAYVTFNGLISVGFILGYILHLLADKTTKAKYNIFEFKLPLMDEENKIKIYL